MASALDKKLTPDAALAAVVGADPISRPQVTKSIWAYIKANRLQNPENKREIIADDKLRAVFGKDRATMFELSGLTNKHLQG